MCSQVIFESPGDEVFIMCTDPRTSNKHFLSKLEQ